MYIGKFEFRKLCHNDIDNMLICCNEVLLSLNDKEHFIPPNKSSISKILSGEGESIGCFANGKLIGFSSIVFPHTSTNNLIYNLKGLFDYNSIAQFKHGLVSRKYRGNKLLYQMLEMHKERLIHRKICCLISSVHPFNFPSLKTAFDIGQYAVLCKELYNGHLRYIMFRDFRFNRQNEFSVQKAFSIYAIEEITYYLSIGFQAIRYDTIKNMIYLAK